MRRLLLSARCLGVALWWRVLPLLLVLTLGCDEPRGSVPSWALDELSHCENSCSGHGMQVLAFKHSGFWVGPTCFCSLPDAGTSGGGR